MKKLLALALLMANVLVWDANAQKPKDETKDAKKEKKEKREVIRFQKNNVNFVYIKAIKQLI